MITVYAPLGMLGYGFPMRSLKAALEHGFDVIALDAGSVDPGPYYLGTGKSFTSRTMVKRDLKLIVEAGQTAHVPILIGTACGSGATPHLDWAMRILDEIVEELAKDPAVSEAYRHWYDLREDVLRTYRDDLPERIPLSRQKEFRQIKNLVIQEAANLGDLLQNFDPQGPQSEEPVESLRQKAERGDTKAQYLLGKQLLAKAKGPGQITEAVRFLTASATQGNQYAQYALGRLFLSGEDVPKDQKVAIHWLTLAAEQGSEYARFLLNRLEDWQRAAIARGVLRLFRQVAGIFQDRQPVTQSRVRFVDSKLRRKLRQKKAALGQKPGGADQQQG